MTETTKALTKPLQQLEGLEGLDQSDLVVPRYRIVQPTSELASSGVCPSGVFRSNISDDHFESATIVPLRIDKARVMFTSDGGGKPVCKSDDAKKPSPIIANPRSNVCGRFSKGRWQDVCDCASWSSEGPPECSLVYNMIALNIDKDARPFMASFKGSSVRPVKALISELVSSLRAPYTIHCKMSAAKTKNQKGTFFVVEFSDIGGVEPPDAHRDAFEGLRSYEPEKSNGESEAPVGSDDIPF